jgi:hypothetical protein
MTRAVRAALVLCFLWCADAMAADEPILLVVDPGSASAARRVEAELTSGGFTVVTRMSSEAADRKALLEAARSIDAIATVRVHATGEGAELWIVDRVTGKTVVRDIGRDQAIDDATLATKTTELLRASLLEVRTEGFHAAEVPVPDAVEALVPPPPPPAPPSPSAPRGVVGIGGTVGWGGQLGALAFVSAELRTRLSSVLAAGAVVTIPVSGSSLEGPEGSSTQLLSHASVVLDAAPLGFGARFTPFVGATAGVLWFHVSGTANAPYTSESSDLFSALFGARAGGVLRLTQFLSLRAQVTALASLPQPAVIYVNRTVASLVEPLVEGTVALDVIAW